jgi:hypothetical protein
VRVIALCVVIVAVLMARHHRVREGVWIWRMEPQFPSPLAAVARTPHALSIKRHACQESLAGVPDELGDGLAQRRDGASDLFIAPDHLVLAVLRGACSLTAISRGGRRRCSAPAPCMNASEAAT